jgi:SecD/SecF fusion protein
MKQQKNGMRILVVLATLGLSIWTLIPTFRTAGMSLAEKQTFAETHPTVAAKAIKLGLDLQGGSHLVLEVEKDGLDEATAKDATDRALEVLRNRIDQFGVSEPEIRKAGDSRILVQLAGVAPEQAKGLLSSTAQLEFKLLREQADVKIALDRIDNALARGLKAVKPAAVVVDSATSDSAAPALDSLASAKTDSIRKDSAAQLARSLFGGNQLAGAGAAADTVAKADTALKFSERAFTSLLVPYGNQIAVEAKNIDAVKRLLARQEVKDAIRASESDVVWARKNAEVEGGRQIRVIYVLKRRAEMKGDYVADAAPSFEQGGMRGGAAMVELTLKDRGPKEFARITGANVGKQLAIILDGSVYSAPVIQGRIGGGVASITGLDGIEEARQLAIVLRAGALPAPMHIAEERSVGPALGAENIKQGTMAALLGTLAVFLFMGWQYLGSGMLANAALVLNIFLLGAILAAFKATLTLPGIAGIVLTVGMAVDANVLIYERIREELRAGRAIRHAIDAGYKRAFSAIFDSNITTVLTAFVLYKLGTGPIRGFGLTLTIGIAVSMFTALFCTRIVFDMWLAAKERTSLSIGKSIMFFENAKLDILGNSKKIGVVSAIAMGVILLTLLVPKGKDHRLGINWGIDFTGGVMMTVKAEGAELNTEKVAEHIAKTGLEGVNVRTLGAPDEHLYAVNFRAIDLEGAKGQEFTADAQKKVVETLAAEGAKVEILSTDLVGPKVGKELKWNAIQAALLSMLVIVFYVWFRFGRHGLGYGIASIVTLIHDCIITLGLFIVLDLEVDMTVIAAILTLIGYSLNDTIVIFDRIRENAGKYRKEDFKTLVNNSINETLSRTLMTMPATIAVTGILWAFGGDSLKNFALALTFGVLVGTYSSIAISSPIVIWWVNKRGGDFGGVDPKKAMPRAEMRVGQAPASSHNILGN